MCLLCGSGFCLPAESNCGDLVTRLFVRVLRIRSLRAGLTFQVEMMNTSEFIAQGGYAALLSRAGQIRCTDLQTNGCVAEDLFVDIMYTEKKSASGCVTGGDVFSSGLDTSVGTTLDADTDNDVIMGVSESEQAHAGQANEENNEKKPNAADEPQKQKRRGWGGALSRLFRCMRLVKEPVQRGGACIGRSMWKEELVSQEQTVSRAETVFPEQDQVLSEATDEEEDMESTGGSSYHTARAQCECECLEFVCDDEFQRSWVSRSARKMGRGFKRSVCLGRPPLWHCLQDGYGSVRCGDPHDHSLGCLRLTGLCQSCED